MKSISEMFPNASLSTLERNPHLCIGKGCKTNPVESSKQREHVSWASKVRMNKTEYEYSLFLEQQKRNGEILRYEYEGMTLRWAGIRYTPDFVVFNFAPEDQIRLPGSIKFIEVKGPFIKGKFGRAVERFRHARTYWPEFQFELWQKQKSGWKRIH